MPTPPIPTEVYKVVGKAYGSLVSAMMPSQSFGLEYKPGAPTTPKIGSIFAFDTLENAKCFCQDYLCQEIWTADALIDLEASKSIYQEKIIISPFMLRQKETVAHWWNTKKIDPIHKFSAGYPPTGTLLCTSITLKERVYFSSLNK